VVLLVLSRPVLSWFTLGLLPLVFILWTNLHASFGVGLILVGVCLVGRVIDACLERSSWDVRILLSDRQVCRLLLLMLLVSGTWVINPRGVELVEGLIEPGRGLLHDHGVKEMARWQPLNFDKWGLPHSMFLGSVVLLVLTQLVSPRAFSATQLLVLLTFAVLALVRQRMLVWWYPLVPWIVLPHWLAIAEARGWTWPRRWDFPQRYRKRAALVLVLVLVVLLTPVSWLWQWRPRSLATTLDEDIPWRVALQLRARDDTAEPWFPALAARLKGSYPEGRFTGLVFTTETTGDFLLWALFDEWQVFMYSQVQFFGARQWGDYQEIRHAKPEWWEVLDRRGVNLIVIERAEAPEFAAVLGRDPAWEILQGAEGGPLLVAVRTTPIVEP
jgi:hypothetical protein